MNTVGEMGERALIELMLSHITPMPDMPVPFWDDVMAVDLDGKLAVLNTDMLVWGTDVPKGMTFFQAARKAVVMNFSDLGAKGVHPIAFLASIGLPKSLPIKAAEEMAHGFESGAREYGGYVIGGDTNQADDVIISGVAFGLAKKERILKRLGAEPGDILATTGYFGDTAAAFKILLEGYNVWKELKKQLLESVYMPRARVVEGVALGECGFVSSSIDSSDGLAYSLYDLCKSSGVGFRIERIPTSSRALAFAEIHGLNPIDLTFYGGEEYELLFTVKAAKLEKVRVALEKVGCELIPLGEATSKREIVYLEEGVEKPVKRVGWEHFKPWS